MNKVWVADQQATDLILASSGVLGGHGEGVMGGRKKLAE